MATYNSTIVHTTPTANGTVVSMKPLSDSLQAMVTAGGLLQTSDTGQVSWGGVASNQTSTNNYEIFKLNDSMVTTYPIFMKFTYASQVTGTPPQFKIQIGTATDGAGNLTGSVSSTLIFKNIGQLTTADATANPIWASCGSGYLNVWGGFLLTPNTVSYGGYALSIERLRDSSGAITGDGVTVNCTSSYNASVATYYTPATAAGVGVAFTMPASQPTFVGNFSAQRAFFPSLFNNSNWVSPPVMNRGGGYWINPLFDGSNYLVSSLQPFAGKLYNPGIACLIVDSNFPSVTPLSMSIYSTAHNYLTANINIPSLVGATVAAGNPVNSSWGAPVPLAAIPAFLYE